MVPGVLLGGGVCLADDAAALHTDRSSPTDIKNLGHPIRVLYILVLPLPKGSALTTALH
jgi:hypothetical protein